MLQLDRITKSYTTGDFTQAALDGVSINFRDNEFVAILGPSGSGKTTLLNIIGGLDHYDNGDLVIDGVSTRQYRDADWDTYRNNRVGFVFQSYNLIPHQNVLANVEMSLTLSGVPKATRHERALAALDAVGLAEHANKRPNQLSGGQAQRVAIARALVNDPTIVLADEPTGALDSKTSVDVMDLLQDIAKDRLVIMVTHNPQLAHQYATRIVEIRDGHIVGDSRPFDPSTETVPEPRPLRRTAMSFMTALALSAKNLLTKKGRTIMTAFAGSIGIIGIALILALATGANAYIQSVEEETLSEYPLQVLSTGFDIGGMFSNMVGDADDEDGEGEGAGDGGSAGDAGDTSSPSGATSSGTVEVTRMVTAMVSGIGANDLASLKAFFDENGGNIHDFARSIEYSYGISPLIYAQIPSGKWQQVNPDTARSAYTTDSLSSSYMASLYSSNQFFALPENPALYQDSYELVAGRWPADASECILSLPASGRISDYLLYDLGLRDVEERRQLMDGVMSGEGASISLDTLSYTYEDLLALTFKVVNVPDTYEFDTIYGIWKAKTDDAAFMQAVIERSADLRMVGIVKPKKDANATMLQSGIFYLPALIEDTIRAAGASEMVQQQLANPEIDVLTGKPFGQADADENSLDLAQIFSVDEAALGNAFSFDAGALRIDFSGLAGIISPERLADILRDNLSEETLAELAAVAAQDQEKFDAVRAIFQDAMDAYLAASTADPSLTPAAFFGEGGEGYAMLQAALGENSPLAESALADALSEVIGQVIAEVAGEVAAAVQRIMGQMLSRLPNALHIDAEALGSAFQVNMSTEDLNTIIASMMSASRRTFENNLSTFNYADLATPIQIDIYPNDFEAKSSIIAILDQYNVDAIAAGEEERAINFTDIVGTLMSSVTTIIDVISAMLIAFVSISLVVSSIMIGIITYISVLERKKEIGVLRALGARKRDISRVFNAETVIEGLLAGIFGVSITALLCIPACAIVDAVFGVPRVAFLPFEAAVALVALSVFLTLISGLIPATAASNADPVEALRSE